MLRGKTFFYFIHLFFKPFKFYLTIENTRNINYANNIYFVSERSIAINNFGTLMNEFKQCKIFLL